jgi:hypothetical protein
LNKLAPTNPALPSTTIGPLSDLISLSILLIEAPP